MLNLKKISASIKKYNPGISNWKSIPAGEKIYLEIPFRAVNSDSILITKKRKTVNTSNNIEASLETTEKIVEKEQAPESFIQDEKAVTDFENKVRYSLIASTSSGTFKETSAAGNKISSKQFSPITLGLGASISDQSRKWNLSSSVYFSYITSQDVPATAGLTNSSISTPVEVGLTAYAQRTIVPELVSIYAGMDAERFSTLNLVEIELGSATVLKNREHTVIYGTAGAGLNLKIKNYPVNFRFSYSKSLLSDINVSSVKAYKGWKSIFYIQVPLNERFFLSTFFKYHNMSGESELTVTRIGIGIGYVF